MKNIQFQNIQQHTLRDSRARTNSVIIQLKASVT
jgi:hypothetical protein